LNANPDTLPDIMVWGNFHANNVEIGRQDAFSGLLLLNTGGGRFKASGIPGFNINGQAGKVHGLQIKGVSAFIIPRNDDSLRVIRQYNR
jgi:hypothetical protein